MLEGSGHNATDVPNGFPTIFIQVHLKGADALGPATGEVEKASDAVEEVLLSPRFADRLFAPVNALQASLTCVRAYFPIEFVNQAERAIESATASAFAMEPSCVAR
jgi:hypothetical protein